MSHDEQEEHHHLVEYGTYVLIWFGLLIFTGLTVAVAGFNFKSVNVAVVLLVAATKSTLVLNYFMHLKYEKRLFRIMFLVTVITIAIFIILTFSDVLFR